MKKKPPTMVRQGYDSPSDCMRHIIAEVIHVAWKDVNGHIETSKKKKGLEEEIMEDAREFFGSPLYRFYMECLGMPTDWGIDDIVMDD